MIKVPADHRHPAETTNVFAITEYLPGFVGNETVRKRTPVTFGDQTRTWLFRDTLPPKYDWCGLIIT